MLNMEYLLANVVCSIARFYMYPYHPTLSSAIGWWSSYNGYQYEWNS